MIDRDDARLIADLIATRVGPAKLAYTVKTAADACDLSPRTIQDAITNGTLKASKRGKQWVITKESLLRWLE